MAAALGYAQELEIAISPSPVGSGARAAGMADAFLAIADDATAASWNPAGLVQLERPEISLVGSFNAIAEDFTADGVLGFDSTHSDENFDLNYLSVVYPLPILVLGRNVTVALNYQRKYDFSRKFDVTYTSSPGGLILDLSHWRFEQEGGLSTVTPALAFEITKRLSLGVALNLWRSTWLDENGWSQKQRLTLITLQGPNLNTTYSGSNEEYKDLKGENLTVGFLWNITDKWNLGARYDTAFTAEADYKRRYLWVQNQFASAERPEGQFLQWPAAAKEKREVHFPDTVAVGISYRRNDRLTLSMDVTRTDWSDFYVEAANGRKTSLVDGSEMNYLPEDIGDDLRALPQKPDFEPTYTIRFGTEYVFIPKEPRENLDRLWTLRGGLFYDQEPARGHPDDFYGLALGLGLLLNQRVNIDLAYQLRYGDGVNSDFVRGFRGFEEDVIQHRALLSTVIYF